MDYRKTAQEIYDHVGKKENIISAAHCATRLRLVIADNDKADKEYVENIDGVKGVFFAQGQMQIILGTGVVNKVYDEFIQIAGISESSKDELKKVAASKANPVQRLIKTLGDIFVPIIPAIVASGFLMGIMEALNFMVNNGFLNINTNGSIYVFAQLFSNTAYTFLPILIAYSGAKVFGANPYLGAVIGMIMIHPNLQNAWTVATEGVQATQKVWFITICAIGITVLVYLGKSFILHTVFGKIDQDVMHHADIYLLIVAASIPFMALYNGGAAIFRTMGNSKVTMQISIIMNVINIGGNAILIYGFHRGTEGVAIPTLVSRMTAAIIIIALL